MSMNNMKLVLYQWNWNFIQKCAVCSQKWTIKGETTWSQFTSPLIGRIYSRQSDCHKFYIKTMLSKNFTGSIAQMKTIKFLTWYWFDPCTIHMWGLNCTCNGLRRSRSRRSWGEVITVVVRWVNLKENTLHYKIFQIQNNYYYILNFTLLPLFRCVFSVL